MLLLHTPTHFSRQIVYHYPRRLHLFHVPGRPICPEVAVIRRYLEKGPAAVGEHAVADGSHGVLPYSEADVTAVGGILLVVLGAGDGGEVGRGEVNRCLEIMRSMKYWPRKFLVI